MEEKKYQVYYETGHILYLGKGGGRLPKHVGNHLQNCMV
jgi:hypothetical protein